jgi:pre-60S factor REI1
MSKSHNFFIPDPDYLIDISSFLTFLNTIISEFHECLFCGTARSNKFAAQDHMKSKGHCRIDLEDECEEWVEFWDYPLEEDREDEDEDVAERVENETELHLESGKTLGHRSRARYFRQNASRTPLSPASPSRQLHSNRTLNPEERTRPATSTALAIRAGTSTSLIGVSELQQRALRATEKKTMQMETRARNRYQSGVERSGNVQKFFKVLRRLERVPGSV